MLNEIGFTWDAQEVSWERQMGELRLFYEKYGTCDISRSDKGSRKLYRWIREQRRIYRDRNAMDLTGGLSEKRIAALKSIGFAFESIGGTFSLRLAELIDFYREYNHCQVPREKDDLYQWLQRIRRQYKMKMDGKESILQERHIQALNRIEFPWILDEADSITEHVEDDSLRTSTSKSSAFAHSSTENMKMDGNSESCIARPLKKRRVA